MAKPPKTKKILKAETFAYESSRRKHNGSENAPWEIIKCMRKYFSTQHSRNFNVSSSEEILMEDSRAKLSKFKIIKIYAYTTKTRSRD
jgi:hypothetical protein